MEWYYYLPIVFTIIALCFAVVCLLCGVGNVYVLLYDLGIKAGLIRDDEED